MYLKSGKNKEVIKNYWRGTWEIRSPKCKGDGAAECQFRERQKVEAETEIRGQTVRWDRGSEYYHGEFGKKKQEHRSLAAAGVEDTPRETVGLQQ